MHFGLGGLSLAGKRWGGGSLHSLQLLEGQLQGWWSQTPPGTRGNYHGWQLGSVREHSFTMRVRQVNRNFRPKRSVGIRWREQCQTRACAGTILRPAGYWSGDTSMALQLAGAVRVLLLLLECHRVTDLWPEINFDDS